MILKIHQFQSRGIFKQPPPTLLLRCLFRLEKRGTLDCYDFSSTQAILTLSAIFISSKLSAGSDESGIS